MNMQRVCSMAAVSLLALLASPLGWAQPVSVGVRGGIQLIDWHNVLNTNATAEGVRDTSRWTVGPFVSVKLPARLAVQAEALRRSYGFERSAAIAGSFNSHRESGSAWDLPLLLVWRPDYQENGWQPYVGGGPAVRYVNATATDVERLRFGVETTRPGRSATSDAGFMATAGMERELGPVAFSVELRYGFCATSKAWPEITPNRNQIGILLGIRSR